MHFRKLFLLVSLCTNIIPEKAFSAVFDLNLFYDSRTLTTSSAETGTKMFIEGAAMFEVLRKPHLVVGWAYGMFSTTDATTSTTTISTSDMGPRFGWFFDKQDFWSLFLTYNLLASASYAPGGGTAETWRGTSLKAEVGWAPEVSENLYIGIRLNYYSATYTESLEGSSNYEAVSYPRSFIYPSLSISYRM